jgi:hypothetical protein
VGIAGAAAARTRLLLPEAKQRGRGRPRWLHPEGAGGRPTVGAEAGNSSHSICPHFKFLTHRMNHNHNF